jgi:hypothetical protein
MFRKLMGPPFADFSVRPMVVVVVVSLVDLAHR